MSAGYDGTVKIDTSMDTKGFNSGTKSLGGSLKSVMASVKGIAAAMGLAFSGAALFNFVKRTLESFDLMSSSAGQSIRQMQDSFSMLKGAIANALVAALLGLMPYIMMVVNWLTNLFTIAAQLISVFFGVSAAMTGAASGAGGLAKNTKKAAKEAKGALAAFDQINVLSNQQQNQAPDAGGGGGGGGMALPVLKPISPELLKSVEEFKVKLLALLQPAIDAFDRLKKSLEPLGETIWSGLKWAWDNILVPLATWAITDLLPAFLDVLGAAAGTLNAALIALQPLGLWFWDNFLQPLAAWTGGIIIDFLKWLVEKLDALTIWINNNQELFQFLVIIFLSIAPAIWLAQFAIAAFTVAATLSVPALIASAAATWATLWPVLAVTLAIIALIAIVYLLIRYWPEISAAAQQCWVTIQQLWFLAGYFFQTKVADPIKNAFFTALDSIAQKFTSIFNGIRDFIRGVVNGIIGTINGMISGVANGINSVVSGANAVGSVVPGFKPIATVSAPKIPYLATGAVIPPNSQFAAILGDQKSGMNIEAPADLIRQIVSEEIGKIQADVTIGFSGSLSGLVRELKPYIDKENVRIGGSLIKSGVTTQ